MAGNTNSGNKLFSSNFVLLILGQVSSLIANTILRFALSMHILELTGSASAFAGILAVSMIPMILLSPLGGILADRANRRNIMVVLDFLSGVTALMTILTIRDTNAVFVAGVVLVVLSVLGAFESPTVQASVPQMQTGDNIIRANAAVNQVAALTTLFAPFIGSACYAAFGLKPVLIVSVFCFFLTAVQETFIRLPFEKEQRLDKWQKVVREDFKVSIRFITKENPHILKMLLAVSAVSFFIMGTINVGLPFIIRTVLGLRAEYVGISESICGAAAILGSIILGIFVKYMRAAQLSRYLSGVGICMIPMGLAFLLKESMGVYTVIMIAAAAIQILLSIFSIYCMSLIQQQTPNALLGKVMAYVATITLCAQPLGQIFYGILFDSLTEHIMWIMIGSAVCIIVLSILTKSAFYGLKDYVQQEECAEG